MKQNITESTFIEQFKKMGRGDNFSRKGLIALYNYLIQLEEDFGEEFELDVINLCCGYSEYDNAVECVDDFGYDLDFDEGDCPIEKEDKALEFLKAKTALIEFDGGIIIELF